MKKYLIGLLCVFTICLTITTLDQYGIQQGQRTEVERVMVYYQAQNQVFNQSLKDSNAYSGAIETSIDTDKYASYGGTINLRSSNTF